MIENLEQLKRYSRRELQQLYARFFTSHEGQMILEDLKFQCFFYHQTNGPRDEGKSDVLKYIMNKVTPLNEADFDEKPVQEIPNDSSI